MVKNTLSLLSVILSSYECDASVPQMIKAFCSAIILKLLYFLLG